MDFKINKIDLGKPVGNIRRTNRVNKPNKDESENNQEKFKDQFNQLSDENEPEARGKSEDQKSSAQKTDSSDSKGKKRNPDPSIDDTLGQHVDIKV